MKAALDCIKDDVDEPASESLALMVKMEGLVPAAPVREARRIGAKLANRMKLFAGFAALGAGGVASASFNPVFPVIILAAVMGIFWALTRGPVENEGFFGNIEYTKDVFNDLFDYFMIREALNQRSSTYQLSYDFHNDWAKLRDNILGRLDGPFESALPKMFRDPDESVRKRAGNVLRFMVLIDAMRARKSMAREDFEQLAEHAAFFRLAIAHHGRKDLQASIANQIAFDLKEVAGAQADAEFLAQVDRFLERRLELGPAEDVPLLP